MILDETCCVCKYYNDFIQISSIGNKQKIKLYNPK